MRALLAKQTTVGAGLVAAALGLLLAGCGDPAERAADDVAEKNAAARGGLKAWRSVQTLTMAGTLEAGVPRDPVKLARRYQVDPTTAKVAARKAAARPQAAAPENKPVALPFAMELKRPRKTRLEIRFQGDTAVQVYDGAQGWKLRPFLGRHEVEPFGAEELRLASQQADLDGPLIDYAAKGAKAELLGTEKVEGRDAFKLKVTSEHGQARTVWVDAQTYLDVRVDGTRRLDGKDRTVLTTFRDWKAVDGLMVPHLMETTVEGVPGSEKIVVESVAVNASLPDSRFGRPD